MEKIYIYVIFGLLFVLIYTVITTKKYENFENLGYLSNLWPFWNIPTRIPKLFYDIRGDPNLVYRRHVLGSFLPYGYVFGPYLYDSQGKLLYDKTKPKYIA
jgi:hypothetical protein